MNINQEILEMAAQRYFALAHRFRSDAPTEAVFNYFQGSAVFPTAPGLLELNNALVLAGEWFVVADGVAYCDAFMQSPFPPLIAYLVHWTRDKIMLMNEPPVELPTQRGFLLGGCPNYCHWLIDYLPRLEFYRPNCGPLLVNSPIQPFQTEALTRLGVKMSDVVPLDYPRAYTVRQLFHPRTTSTICQPPLRFQPAALDWLRYKFNDLLTPGGGRRKLFISRAGNSQAHFRRLLNEDEIASIAREQGFEIVRCEELSFAAQVTMFSEASIIAGAHGAGLINMIFAPPTAKIVEMIGPRFIRDRSFPNKLIPPMFMKLASIVGQHFVRIVGLTDENVPAHLNWLPFETYIIDPAEFSAAIRS
jgi:hypothetical protein